nr:MAG TPA: hypothetical protein [Crassvirales sp.]
MVMQFLQPIYVKKKCKFESYYYSLIIIKINN